MYYVYVIESINFGKHYSGFTEDLEKRLKEHNSGRTRSNKAYRPFKYIYTEEHSSIEDARKREVYFKTAAGRRYIKKILAQ